MPSLDAESNPHPLNQQDHSLEPSTYQASNIETSKKHYFDDGIPSLSDTVYKPTYPRRPVVSTKVGVPGSTPGKSTPQDDILTNLQDYYRSNQERLGREKLGDGRVQGAIRNDRIDGTSQPTGRRQPGSPRLRNGEGRTISPIASRVNTAQHPSSANHERSPLSAAKSSPTLSSTARNRQTSLQELVNKFNQTPDEVPPLPKKPASRSPSASSSRGQGIRSRTASQAKASGGRLSSGSLSSDNMSIREPRFRQQEKSRTQDDRMTSPKLEKNYTLEASETVPAKPLTSESLVDLAPEMMNLPRKPLFGEVVRSHIPQPNAGYGIPISKRRRGSEGSLHSPRTLYSDQDYSRRRDHSPDSPSAWYYATAPPLEEIKAKGEIPEPPPNLHRRTRSDLHGMPSSPISSRKYTNTLSPPSSPLPTETPRRTSQSRIPVSTRRFSVNSDSGNSPPSTRTSSAAETAPTKLSTRSRAPPPKPLQTARISPRYSRSNTPQKSPRYQHNTSRPVASPSLPAFISEPLPKKSPPLRSSRPRQPVSNASTSASRARAVDRVGGENHGSRNPKEGKLKRPPELGALDFAARRQRIQQAFTKTVREEEEREIRRASIARELSVQASTSVEASTDDVFLSGDLPKAERPVQGIKGREQPDEAGAEASKSEPGLTLQTGQLSDRSTLNLSLEDSPTLGNFNSQFSPDTNGYGPNQSTPNSDIDPGSAVTAGTGDSVDTFFDDEAQDESRDSSRPSSLAQPALLQNIMAMRNSRTPSPPGIRKREINEEHESGDDRESIQIMLGATPVLEKRSFNDDHERAPSSEDPDSRWSMSSWTSSNKSRDEKDTFLERVEEHPPSQATEDPHLSISTSASELTQPAWSPTSVASPQTNRTTLDSDRYSTVNRVLDQYHDPNALSPDLIRDAQHQSYNRSPELARQGGYDPRKVTQLYLQRIARDRNATPSATPEDIKAHINKRTSSLPVPEPASDKQVRDDMDEKMLPTTGHSRNLSASSTVLDVDDEGNLKPARASLSRPDDFDMSPSLGGFAEQAADTPYEERPTPPEKDRFVGRGQRLPEGYDGGRGRHHHPDDESRPQLPPINFGGQSLAINVEPPQGGDSSYKPSPSVPKHSPPPPPIETREYSRQNVEPSSETPRATRPGNISKPSDDSSISRDEPSTQADIISKKLSPSPEQKRLTRRKNIIKELVDTEHSFGQDMRVVEDIYRGTSNVIISADDVKTLFGNSNQIIEFSTQFLDSLKQASRAVYALSKAKRWKSNRTSNATTYSGATGDESSVNGLELTDDEKDRKTFIGETFGHHMAEMEKTYSEYLKNHDAANQKLVQLQKNQKVQIWLKECKAYASDLTAAWNLDALIVKPVQRLLKYPLLLDQLLEATPENHPDYTALDIAAREMKGVSMRINEAKRRADIMETVTTGNRKRKESDMRTGLAKAFGAGKKIRQQVGSSGMFEDRVYTGIADKFSEHFVRLQVVMRDVEMYTGDVEIFMRKFLDFATAMEAHIDVGQTSFPELESKWHKFRMSMRDMSTMALPDHIDSVRKHVVQPMTTLVKLHEGPQRLMQKREKRLPDYTRYKAITDRGDKPDKKTTDQGEQFLAVNSTLKDELPQLFTLTGKLMERCLSNFVQLQFKWFKLWKLKLKQAIDIRSATQDGDFQEELIKIVKGFSADVAFHEAQVASLGLCNGSMLNETPNLVTFAAPGGSGTSFIGRSDSTLVEGQYEGTTSPRAGPSFDSTRRTLSVSSDRSPVLPQPDFGSYRPNGSFFNVGDASTPGPMPQRQPSQRIRASSSVSGNGPQTPYPPGSWRSYSNTTTPINSTPGRPPTATGRIPTDPTPSLRPSIDSSHFNRLSDDSALARPPPGVNYTPSSQARSTSPSRNRFSGYFSSAMPMSDSPPTQSPTNGPFKSDFNVIFLAASVYEFNIDRARKEAGYPYLTYVAGEIFDVIGEKGSYGLRKIKTIPTALLAGSGTNTLSNWLARVDPLYGSFPDHSHYVPWNDYPTTLEQFPQSIEACSSPFLFRKKLHYGGDHISRWRTDGRRRIEGSRRARIRICRFQQGVCALSEGVPSWSCTRS
ncbi:uncharacterized protein KY384_009016 [Bacidia gigantensis]|uniref:uncharacterized protein n=1 Tax=Bacidia gigantensis TaxID=2732470 RepID=UPI001D039394|nr:uncharacterized protein KY384_009016 [Bacidia gigantensis]KAG8525372.1 hypothetical protein KY384_009016 [Bacidia gigantensis]